MMVLCAGQSVVAFMTVRVYRVQPIVYIFNSLVQPILPQDLNIHAAISRSACKLVIS